MKKRLLSLALGTMMVLSTLAGCGSKDGGSAAVNTKPEEQGKVLNIYCWNEEFMSSGVCVSVSVDVPSDVYRSSGLFVSRTDTEIPGHLFGILEVGEASGSDDKCCCERYAYTFDSCQQRELSAELDFDKLREFRLQPVTPLFKELDRFVYGMGRSFVRDRQAYEGASEIRHGRNLLGELTYDRSFLSEPQDSLSLHLERTRVHLLSVQGNESCIALIGLDRREHGFGEVLYLQRILHA